MGEQVDEVGGDMVMKGFTSEEKMHCLLMCMFNDLMCML